MLSFFIFTVVNVNLIGTFSVISTGAKRNGEFFEMDSPEKRFLPKVEMTTALGDYKT